MLTGRGRLPFLYVEPGDARRTELIVGGLLGGMVGGLVGALIRTVNGCRAHSRSIWVLRPAGLR